jgi:hypothetical protein
MSLGMSRIYAAACTGLIFLCAALAPRSALAWDPEADRAVALAAYDLLSPEVRAKVEAILDRAGPIGPSKCPAKTLAGAVSLVECLHGSRNDFMRGVVYDPIPLCPSPDAPPPCAKGQCASQLLKREIATLKLDAHAPQADPDDTALALEAVVYLVSELHQPLHAADNDDRSGERLRTTLPGSGGKPLSLYSVWDEDLVALAIGDADTGLPYLNALTKRDGQDWAQGGVDAWVADTHKVAVDSVYSKLPSPPACGAPPKDAEALDSLYVQASAEVVRRQLAKAAVRLASVLTTALN